MSDDRQLAPREPAPRRVEATADDVLEPGQGETLYDDSGHPCGEWLWRNDLITADEFIVMEQERMRRGTQSERVHRRRPTIEEACDDDAPREFTYDDFIRARDVLRRHSA